MKSRRLFLQFLALAPIAAPAVIEAATSSTPSDVRKSIRDLAADIDIAETYPRGMSPNILYCDEFGNPFTRAHLTPEFEAQVEEMRARNNNSNVEALLKQIELLDDPRSYVRPIIAT